MDKAVIVEGWHGLRAYGIVGLTGEIDPYCLRVLCDLTARGKRIISEFFGIYDNAFGHNWNTETEDGVHVASVVLPRGVYDDLVKYILFHEEKAAIVLVSPGSTYYGMSYACFASKYADVYEDAGFSRYTNPRSRSGDISSRGFNAHAATGRSM